MKRTMSPAERARELAAIMTTLTPSERAAVERKQRSSGVSQRWGRMTARERWEYCKREFRAELSSEAAWNDAPPQLQRWLAEVHADAEGRAALSERERRALAFDEGVRWLATPGARLSVARWR